MVARGIKWAYGVTTVHINQDGVPTRRKDDTLPKTLASLKVAGFPTPTLFVDGCSPKMAQWYMDTFQLPVTPRWPNIRTFGNWYLSALELSIREPDAQRYALFQDDFVTYTNLRQYLEKCEYPARGYWNLYTFPRNQVLAPRTEHGGTLEGWYKSDQKGKGAVALVFDRPTLLALLSQMHMLRRPEDCTRGWRAVDGGIVEALMKEGIEEYVHSPSLVQHIGDHSSMGNAPHVRAESFRGEGWDCLQILAGR